MQQYKCHVCKLILNEEQVVENKCPKCGNNVEPMCHRDHTHCSHPITAGTAYCPDCNKPMCPQCKSHDVFILSRVTGYLQDTAGWNQGKIAELKDRKRYNSEDLFSSITDNIS